MKISLNSFEQNIDPVILKRGLTYFNKGLVEQDGEGKTGDLIFTVHGSDDYMIEMMVAGEVIQDYRCDCPYTDGPVCKHIVAVIFYLTKDELQLSAAASRMPARRKRGRPRIPGIYGEELSQDDVMPKRDSQKEQSDSPKRKREAPLKKPRKASVKTQIEGILQQLTEGEIRDYLAREVLKVKTAQSNFLAYFAAKNDHESIETYRTQIKAILSKGKGRYGYIDYKHASKVGDEVQDIVVSGISHLENGNYRSAMFIGMAVLDEMTKAIQFMDDSSGEVGLNINIAWTLLKSISKCQLPPSQRETLLDYVIGRYKSNEFTGWDWHNGMIEIAAEMIVDSEGIDMLIGMLNQPARNEYDLHHRQQIIYNLLLKKNDQTAAQLYLEQNLNIPELRQIRLQQLFDQGEYGKVKQTAEEAIALDKKTRPGLLNEWYDWLIKTAIAEEDSAKVTEYAHIQIMHNGREKLKYVDLLRHYTPAEEWHEVYVSLLNNLANSGNWMLINLIPEIAVAEQDWQNLYTYLRNESAANTLRFSTIVEYGSYLLDTHTDEIGQLMEDSILNDALIANKRRDYANLAKHLRQMKKMGYSELVDKLVRHFGSIYRHRPAMIEEIQRV